MSAATIANATDPKYYEKVQSIPEMWAIAAQRFGSIVALNDPHATPTVSLTYAELYQQIQQFAKGLHALGIQPKQHMALFSDNQPRWLIADQGMMALGVVNAVRGSQAEASELRYILSHSDSVALVVENVAVLEKLLNDEPLPVDRVILLSDETPPEISGLKILTFKQLLELGQNQTLPSVTPTRDDVATLLYTSGTSGQPKGVMLTHGNLLSQVAGASTVVYLRPGDRVLSILPIWHSYERTFEYFIFANGCSQIYTNIRFVKKDIKDYKPMYMVGVPRLWDSIYEGVQKQFRDQPESKQKLVNFFLDKSDRYIKARRTIQGLNIDNLNPSMGDRLAAAAQVAALAPVHALGDKLVYKKVRDGLGGYFRFVVSGGGSIAEHLEDFFEIVGINILSGYGLTETSPITHVRRPGRNIRGADGQALPYTETRIVDPETRQDLPVGKQGLILVRGRQIMKGYYKNPEATQKAIDPEGWFDTGDLGWISPWGDLTITGRAKDTIVLTNGENIEPLPIENACMRSVYIDQIMLVGQDQKVLGALLVPNFETLKTWAEAQNLPVDAATGHVDLDSKAVQDLFRQELNREVTNRPGYRPDDRIGPIRLLTEPFTVDNGMLTQTLKVKRAVVMERYRSMIDGMFV
ncbi:AMP-dependent synthetase/ligase [Leptolyngbya sp. AN02str]|uniref:AMP-dependent synthetase/ligase n=1 Tax=Leptolyngbya sp. AN02str TaxID=3423363 RepID=UPI003D311F49